MKSLRGMLVCCGLSMSLLTGAALAMPPVLEKAPEGYTLMIATPNPVQLQKSLDSLSTAIESPMPLPAIDDLLAMAGISGGVDSTKSFAVAMMPAKDGEEQDQNIILLIPVTSYAEMLAGFEVKPTGGVDTLEINGEPAFTRDIGGGYAILGPSKVLIEGYRGADAAAMKANMGKAGMQVADTSDIVFIANMSVAGEFAQGAVDGFKSAIADQMAGVGMEAGDGESPMMAWIMEAMSRDANSLVGGMKAGALGMSVDVAVGFKPGSYMAKAFAAEGNASSLIGSLPNTPYIATMAFDLSNPAMKQMVKDMTDAGKKGEAEGAPNFLLDGLTEGDGHAFVVGANPNAVLGGGVFTNTVAFTRTKDPAKTIATTKAGIEALNGQTADGMTYQTSFKPGKAGETPVDVWGVKVQTDGSNQMADQGMNMLFGPGGGPGGYIAPTAGGVVQSFGKNSALMNAAINAPTPTGDNLGKDKMLAQIGEQLPKGRLMEVYIGVRPILDMAVPLASMMGAEIDPEMIPETMPPIGLGVSGNDGSAHIRLYMPATVLKTSMALAMQFQGMMGDMGGEPMDDGMDPAPKNNPQGGDGTGQPRF